MDPTTVLFAIEAGARLGRKVYDVLVDSTRERPLFLPVGEIFGSIALADARLFFDRTENRHLVKPGGPYHGLSDKALVGAYRTILGTNQQLGNLDSITDEAVEIVLNLNKFEQFKAEFGSRPAVQRLLGTVVEIGIDYFIANPQAMGMDSSARRLVQAFVSGLDETEFAESDLADIAGEVLMAGLQVFGNNTALLSNDPRIQVLLGGMTGALLDDFGEAATEGVKDRRRNLFKQVTASMLRGAGGSFVTNAKLFIAGDQASKRIIRSTLTQVLSGLHGKEHFFTNESLELLVKSAFEAVAENAELFTQERIVHQIIDKSLNALADREKGERFSEASIATVLRIAFDTLADNIETLIDTEDPQRQLVAEAAAAIAAGFSDSLSGGRLRDLLSTRQFIGIAQIVFKEVAKHPEHLLGDSTGDLKKTALSQIIASVAIALGENPAKLINGQGAVQLLHTALRVAVQNVDKLLDLESQDPRTNLLFQILDVIVTAAKETEDPRRLLTREVFQEVAGKILKVASNNLDVVLKGQTERIGQVLRVVMELSHGKIENRINGGNIASLMEGLLREVLLERLDLADLEAVTAVAKRDLLDT